jgi:hypothetical protein
MTTDTCRQPDDGDGFRANAATGAKRIQRLRRTRDLLLPRLLAGSVQLESEGLIDG